MHYTLKASFASDNNAGVHPEILKAIERVNYGHVKGYGDDPFSKEAEALFAREFGDQAKVFFVFNGTGANVMALQSMTRSFQSIICSHAAHINEDECGAPEKFTGCKLVDIYCADAKLSVPLIQPYFREQGDQHQSQQSVISITQCSEFGTVYTADQIEAICQYAHGNNMLVHVDGARIANAAASLNMSFKDMLVKTGVDILSFGGTKNGMMYGEAVVFINPDPAVYARFIRKQSMQLASKMRYISAQFIALLSDDLWLRNAQHANAMARLMAEGLKDIPALQIVHSVDANSVFCKIPREITPQLQEEYFFYIFDENENIARFMCSWDTKEEDVLRFVAFLKEKLA